MGLTARRRQKANVGYGKALPLMLIPAFALVTAPHAMAEGAVVVYSVTSDGPLSSVNYLDASNNRQQLTNVSVPWSMTFTNQQVNPIYAVSARSTGTQISCTITVNGLIVDRDSDIDGTPDVDCHENYDD